MSAMPDRLLRILRAGLVWIALCVGPAGAIAAPLIIAAEDDWAPYSSVEKGRAEGMAVEIVRAIFAEAGLEATLVPMPYERCMEETASGRIQGCFDTVPDAKLRRNFLFHAKPLFTERPLILVRKEKSSGVLTVRDLRGQRVIVTNGYNYGNDFESDTTIERVNAIGDLNALRMLHYGNAEYAIVYERVLSQLLKGKGQEFKDSFRTAGALPVAELYISFSRATLDAKNVLGRFDAAHLRLIKSGAIRDIETRWK
jgi:polar amino acid transport system substrate-binding protein